MSLLDMFRSPKSIRVPPPHVQERMNSRWNEYGSIFCIKSGVKEHLKNGILRVAELGYCTDTDEYFIGTEYGFEPFEEFKLLASNLYIERGSYYFIGLDKLGYEKFLNILEVKSSELRRMEND